MARPKPRSSRRPRASQPAPKRDWLPFAAFVGLTGGFLAAYLAAEMVLYLRPHPLHWLIAALGGVVGYGGGMAWQYFNTRP